jgi:hypothetical protein
MGQAVAEGARPAAERTAAAPVPGAKRWRRWYRPLMLALALAALAFAAAVWAVEAGLHGAHRALGLDYRVFAAYGQRLIATGSLYTPAQLAGPYEWASLPPDPLVAPFDPATIPCVYPPPVALLALAAALLPWPAWWIAPLGVVAWCVASWRPAPWTWPLLAAVLAWPGIPAVAMVGGSAMAMTAAIAAGLRWGWPSLLLVVKPTFAPLLLVGAHRRSFWLAVPVAAVLSWVFVQDWIRYPAVLANAWPPAARDLSSVLPFAAIPLIAWLGRARSK